jgi:hypothetical protein
MPPSDGVSTLNELNAKYQKWVKNSKTRESGSVGSCNADSLYDDTEIADGTSTGSRIHDYALCEDSKCTPMTKQQWLGTYGNCKGSFSSDPPTYDHGDPVLSTADQNAWKNHYDPCFNLVTNNTPGFSYFDLGGLSDFSNTYDPLTNTRSGTVTYGGAGDFEHNTGVWDPSDDRARPGTVHGKRVAYPFGKGGSRTWVDSTITDSAWGAGGDHPCDSKLSREFTCDLDGSTSSSTPGCGNAKNGTEDGSVKFCARAESDYLNTNIAQCCLGSLGNGPEVDTKGIPISSSYKNCPREFCTTRIDEGTVSGAAGVNCENPGTSKDAGGSQDETFCYEMSKECNQFFTDKCTTDVFSNPQGDGNPLKTYCNHWGHIQPDSFADKAEEICDINNVISSTETHDYVDAEPTANDLTHVKKVLNTPLCRNFITDPDHYAIERPKLQHLCSHYMKPNEDTGVWEKQPLVDNEGHDVLENVCGCHYPDAFYDWWKTTQENRGVGTCQDSAHITQSQLTQETCEAVTGNTWNTDKNAAMLVSSISEAMKPFPQCYYLPCSSSMLFDKEDSRNPCKVSIQACVESITQNNLVYDADGNIEEYPDMTGHAQQTCNQSQLLAPPPPADDDDDSSGIGSTISSLLGGGSGSGSGSGSGGGDNSTMIIIIILVIIIIIIGVFVVVMLNKGNPNPPQQIAQQITQQAPTPA